MAGNDTENKILNAAFQVVSEKTISGTRVALVTEKAGIVPSNLHYYYKTKEDMLMALLERILQEFKDSRNQLMSGLEADLAKQLGGFFEQKKSIIKDSPEYDYLELDFWVHSKVDERVKKYLAKSYSNWREHVCQVLEEHLPQLTEKRKKYISCAMVSLMMGASIQYLIDDSFDLDEYFSLGLDMILFAAGQG